LESGEEEMNLLTNHYYVTKEKTIDHALFNIKVNKSKKYSTSNGF